MSTAAEYRRELLASRPVVVDFFSGIGGLSLGLELAGFFSALHVEVDEIASRYASYNFPLSSHLGGDGEGDLHHLSAKTVAARAGDDIALIAGGPPCQGFSRSGRRRVDDPLNGLVLRMAELVLELQPRAFLIENVPGIRDGEFWQLDRAIEMLGSKYTIAGPKTLFAPDYGVPQIRKRVFIIGIHDSEGASPAFPSPTHQSSPGPALFPLPHTPTVIEAIGDLPDCDQFGYLVDGDVAPYQSPPHSEYSKTMRLVRRLGRQRGYLVSWGGKECTNLRRTQHGDDLTRRLLGLGVGCADKASRIRRLDPSGLSTTIRAGTTQERGAWSAPRPCHPLLPRVLTTRECARLQSFPDWFRFHPTKWHGNRQVGNAVPPLLARAVGRAIIGALGAAPKPASLRTVKRDEGLISADVLAASSSGLSRKRTTHKVVGTDAESRRRTGGA